MTAEVTEVQLVPVHAITVLNPRARNKRVFNELVDSIAHLGLKKPITVSPNPGGGGYNLVCGQGRLEAFMALGQTEIPAVVLQATEEDCYVMSLVENLARRQHSSLELVREIGALKDRGYSIIEIAGKTDFSEEYVSAICYMLDHGEERLLAAVDRGVVPASIALEIVRAKDAEVQQALTEAYEQKVFPGNQVLAIRRIIEERKLMGKAIQTRGGGRLATKSEVSAGKLIRAYRKETERQKVMVKKAALTQSRLVFVVNALRRLLADEHLMTLLRAEAMTTLPRPLAERLGSSSG
jgi:ParB family transcriptional regulator, chromosome partitioning protein